MEDPPPAYGFRPVELDREPNDLPFLRELYASTRREELAPTGWPWEQIELFLLQQFEAQHRYYLEHFSSAEWVVVLDAELAPVGRLYLDERETEFHIIDIALLPHARGQGIGSRILGTIIDRATTSGKSVTIHVEANNPAMSLYQRLGFQTVEAQGIYFLMKHHPTATP
jgi:ribosomal protein S18 acetylase RimI-like enzyme